MLAVVFVTFNEGYGGRAELACEAIRLGRALALRGHGPYVVQAAIAALHLDERRDWPQIAALYDELARLTGSPVVEVNRSVAVAEAVGPRAGLEILDRLGLDQYRYLHTARAEMLPRLGRVDEARAPPTAARWRSSPTTPSGGCSSAASPASGPRPADAPPAEACARPPGRRRGRGPEAARPLRPARRSRTLRPWAARRRGRRRR